MQATNEQIERINKFFDIESPYERIALKDGAWSIGMYQKSEWQIVGIIAEACKRAGTAFSTPEWHTFALEWQSYVYDPLIGGDNILGEGESESPAHAAILAVSRWLEAKGAAKCKSCGEPTEHEFCEDCLRYMIERQEIDDEEAKEPPHA